MRNATECASDLEAHGWVVSVTADTIMAARGEELIHLVWNEKGECAQTYSLWNTDGQNNGRPAARIPFDPEEIPDAELVRLLSGRRVLWWNRLSRGTEDAIMSASSVSITHIYSGMGAETPGDRVISFVDRDKTGHRAFRLSALLRVGSRRL